MVERKAFLANPKHQYCASQWGEHDCSTITKILANPKHQYRVSQWGEHVHGCQLKIEEIITSIHIYRISRINFYYK